MQRQSLAPMDMTKRYLLPYLMLLLLVWAYTSAIAEPASEHPLTLKHGAIGLSKLSNVEDDKVVGGFKYDLIEEIGRRLDWPTEHHICPFQRCLRGLQDGRLNIMVFMAVTPSRSHYMNFLQVWPVPYTIPFYVRRGEEDRLRKYEDFHTLKVGVVNGYSYFQRFDNDPDITKVVVLKESQLPKMLSARRIDAYVGFNIGREDLEKEYPDITPSKYTHEFSETALLAISQASPLSKQLSQLEMVVRNMIDDGTMDQIWYNNFKDYVPPFYKAKDTHPEHNQETHSNQGNAKHDQ